MDRPTELLEPFRSLLHYLDKPSPADFPQNLRGLLLDEVNEEIPESLQSSLPGPLLDELTQSRIDEYTQFMFNSKEILPDECLESLMDELNMTLPDNVPRPSCHKAIRQLLYSLFKQQIDNNQDVFNASREFFHNQIRQHRRDESRRFVLAGHHRSTAGRFPQDMLERWRQSYTETRGILLTFKPMADKVCVIADQVLNIVRRLCKRDEQFSFIRSALQELINGDDGVTTFRERLDCIVSTDPNELEDAVAINKLSEILTHQISIRNRDPADALCPEDALREIIDSTIYELLNIFPVDITQPSIDSALDTHFKLLCDLHVKSELLPPQPAIRVISKPWEDRVNEEYYQYPTCLNSAVGGVRVLQILPCTNQDERIECRLVVHSLYHDGIPEALSYVWGKPGPTKFTIQIDHKDFVVTKNLHTILRELRRPDVTREIWIDAICINQKDSQEKTHQVRFMKEIYSRAGRTIVWLSGGHVANESAGNAEKVENQREDEETFNMKVWYTPLPPKFGGVDVDQYDLATILRKAQKYSMDDTWNERQWVLYAMLFRCSNLVLLHSWWERIWTIQEGACPPNAPIFYFHGHTFSFDDFIAAMSIVTRLTSDNDKHAAGQRARIHKVLGNGETWKVIYPLMVSQPGLLRQGPLLLYYRRGLERERGRNVKSLKALLVMAETYRSTDPRDKIFALQSLLPTCTGLLINVDYSERCEAVFRRTTARYYNDDPEFYLLGMFRFWFESPLSAKEPIGPSWVLDFTYNDASFRGSRLSEDKATLDGFISENRLSNLQPRRNDEGHPRFCTPRVLFCAGRCVDRISMVNHIPRFSVQQTLSPFVASVLLSIQVLNAREALLGLPITVDFGNQKNISFISLVNFFMMQDREPPGLDYRDRDELATARNQELAGKPIFITAKGLVGIAMAPVEPGDFVSWLHGSPIFLILREVKTAGSSSDDDRQHRIVARAIVNDNLLHNIRDIKALVDSTPSRHFKIL